MGVPIISAGGWIRALTGEHGHSPEIASRLAAASVRLLAEDPHHAALWIAGQLPADRHAVVEGIRNPTDLLALLRPGDRVVDVQGAGVTLWEREGLAACRGLRGWLEGLGVSWQVQTRHLAALPVPVAVEAEHAYLHDFDGSMGAPIAGMLLALECYPGQPVTGMFRASAGGTFHDLPLRAFGAWPGVTEHCYSVAEPTVPVCELAPGDPQCRVFDTQRRELTTGRSQAVLHWPEGNTLLHLVQGLEGAVLLWPPHKLLWGSGAALPDWKKRHY